MILCLCLLLPALSPSSQEICSAPGTLPAPILYLSRTSARPGVSVLFLCSMFSRAPATRVIFCKDGEEVSSQRGSEGKLTYDYDHVVSRGSAGNYSCGYESKDSHNRVTRSQLSPAQHLSVTGTLPVPTLYLSQTSARVGDSMLLQCFVLAQSPATRVLFYKDGKEVSSQTGSEEKVTYSYNHMVSSNSAGNYSCGYEIKDSENRVTRSQLSPAQHLSITGMDMNRIVWAIRCTLVLLLLVSTPVITFVLEKRGLPEPTGLEETCGENISILEGKQ